MTDDPTLTREHLVARMHGWGRPRASWRTGGEFERLAIRPDGAPVPWGGSAGIRCVLLRFAECAGWQPVAERPGHPIGLRAPGGGGPGLALEPGGQVELSGAPHRALRALEAELADFERTLARASQGLPLRWLACGTHPTADPAGIGWVPKSRYAVLRRHLAGRGDLAHAMMKATCAVQVNLDYGDEVDCARKVAAAAAVAPLVSAIFANSPLLGGRETGWLSYRAQIWTRTDPARCGLPAVLGEGYRHADWVDHLLAVPMVFLRRGGLYRSAGRATFGRFLARGLGAERAAVEDWDLHLTSVFTDVRVKRTVEIRGMDAVPTPLAVGACALFTGLCYDDAALDATLALGRALGAQAPRAELQARAARSGLRAEAGQPFRTWARELLALARRGLAARDPEALPLLAPLDAQVEQGRSPAEALLEAWRRDPRPEALLAFLESAGQSLDRG